MKNNLSTVICCTALAALGASLADFKIVPQNTINAQSAPLELVTHRDTVFSNKTDTVRDTVHVVKTKKVVKYKRVTHTVRDTVQQEIPILYIKTREHRKETAPDSIPARPRYVVKKAVMLQ